MTFPKTLNIGIGILIAFSGMHCKKIEQSPTYQNEISNFGFQGVRVIQDTFLDTQLVVVGSAGQNFIVSFINPGSKGVPSVFTAVQDSLPIIMRDQDQTYWDLFGNAVSGPRKGEQLTPTTSFMGYWFAFGTFFPGATLFDGELADIERHTETLSEGWLINQNHVYLGSLAKDAIPSIDEPVHIEFKQRDYLLDFFIDDDELVLGIYDGEQAVAYPLSILNWHEIVNDKTSKLSYAINYCPLTGTGMAWTRVLNGTETTFGVSGLLYNNNLILYDRKTESLWSQIRSDCVNGDLIGNRAERIMIVETSWKTWKNSFSNTWVLSENTGFDRNYREYPYGDYRAIQNFLGYPIDYEDNRLEWKERVHGVVIKGEAKVYRFADFQKSSKF